MPKKESDLFKSMLYGDDKLLDEEIKSDFEKSGLSHLLAVSGSNISIFMMIVSYIFKKLNKSVSVVLSIFIGYTFCVFCSFEMSIVRASLFIVISSVFQNKNSSINIYTKIFLSFAILEIYNPYSIFNIGMIMSYVAVISIVMFQNKIFSYLDILLKCVLKIKYKKPKGVKKVIYELSCYILLLFSFTLSVQILLFPIQIYFFNSFFLITFVSNIAISFIDSIFSIIGYLSLILMFVPYVSNILCNVVLLLLKVIILLSNFFAGFENLKIQLVTPDVFSICIYYILILGLDYKKYVILHVKRRYRKYIYICIKVTYILFCVYILSSYVYLNYIQNYVIYFNVEQGNMALIHYKRKNIIVDIGSTKESLATNIISTYLKKKNIQRIDAIILTHFHTDHINGINEDLLKKINVDKVMFSRPKDDQKEYTDMVSLLKENNISMIEVTRDEEITIGDINIYILSPDINYKINDKDIANANSIVSIITINNKNLMFMGDATKASEKYIMSHSNITLKDIYAYQVGHHGSKTSSQDEFISYFNITYAIISAKKKVYNHPAEETLNTLLRHNIKIKVTEKVGSVKLGI